MGQRQKNRRWKRKRIAEIALGLVPVGDHIEAINAGDAQRVWLERSKTPEYYWLSQRLRDKKINYYPSDTF